MGLIKLFKKEKSVLYNIEIPKGREVLTRDFLLNTPMELRQEEIFYHIINYRLNRATVEKYEQVITIQEGYQLIYIILHLQGEVNNGGYVQFFDNFENCNTIVSPYYDLVSKYLKLLNCDAFYKDFLKAKSIYRELRKTTNEELEKKYDEELDELDNNFYKNEKLLIESINEYININIDSFVTKLGA